MAQCSEAISSISLMATVKEWIYGAASSSSASQQILEDEKQWPNDAPECNGDGLDEIIHEAKDGSLALLEGRSCHAVVHYGKALQKILISPSPAHCPEIDIAVLRYAYAMSLVEVGLHKELQCAVSIFTDMLKDPNVPSSFIAPYYGIGKAYFKLNRYQSALSYLSTGLSLIESCVPCDVQLWPGTNEVIQETCPAALTSAIMELINTCKWPPPPCAICLYHRCTLFREIRYSDPDFMGFTKVDCSDRCHLFYHPSCWKTNMLDYEYKAEDEILGTPCFTPDCDGDVIHISIIDLNGLVEKEWNQTKKTNKAEPKKERVSRKKRKKNKCGEDENLICCAFDEPAVPENSDAAITITSNDEPDIESLQNDFMPIHLWDESETLEDKGTEDVIIKTEEEEEKEEETAASLCQVEEAEGSACSAETEQTKVVDEPKTSSLNPQTSSFIPKQQVPEVDSGEQQARKEIFVSMERFLSIAGPMHETDKRLLDMEILFTGKCEQIIGNEGGFIPFLLQDPKIVQVGEYICYYKDKEAATGMPPKRRRNRRPILEDGTISKKDNSNVILVNSADKIPTTKTTTLNPAAADFNPLGSVYSQSSTGSSSISLMKLPVPSNSDSNADKSEPKAKTESKRINLNPNACVFQPSRNFLDQSVLKLSNSDSPGATRTNTLLGLDIMTTDKHENVTAFIERKDALSNGGDLPEVGADGNSEFVGAMPHEVQSKSESPNSSEQSTCIDVCNSTEENTKESIYKCHQCSKNVPRLQQAILELEEENQRLRAKILSDKQKRDSEVEHFQAKIINLVKENQDYKAKMQCEIDEWIIATRKLEQRIIDLQNENKIYQNKTMHAMLKWNQERKELEKINAKLTGDLIAAHARLDELGEQNRKLAAGIQSLSEQLDKSKIMQVEEAAVVSATLLKSLEDAEKRARDAELQVLYIQKIETASRMDHFLEIVDQINRNLCSFATKHKMDLFMYSKVLHIQRQCYHFMDELRTKKDQFVANALEQIESVREGRPLVTLQPLSIPMFSKIPEDILSLFRDSLSLLHMADAMPYASQECKQSGEPNAALPTCFLPWDRNLQDIASSRGSCEASGIVAASDGIDDGIGSPMTLENGHGLLPSSTSSPPARIGKGFNEEAAVNRKVTG